MSQTAGTGSRLADSARERNILIVTSTAHFMAHLYMLVFPSLALALRGAFDLPLDRVLALSFWMYLLYGLGALPAGIITDLLQPRTMLVTCLLGMGSCALWASRATDPEGLSVALAGLGLFAAIYHPAGMALISRGVRRRGHALGLNGVFGNLGVVAAPFTTGLLVTTVGWRACYLMLAVPSLAGGVLALWLRVDGQAQTLAPAPAQGSRRRRALYFLLLCAAMMLGGIAYRGQTLILPAYFAERISFLVDAVARLQWWPAADSSTLAATALTSLAYLAGAAGQMIGGRLADRHDLRRMYLLFHACALPLLWFLGQLAEIPLLICAVAYAFFAFGMQPIENSLVAALTPSRLRSTGYGLKFILTFGVGALAVHLVAHWEQAGGLASVFPYLALCQVFLLVFAGLLWWMSRAESFAAASTNAEVIPDRTVHS